jgi:Ca2+-binding EF-hand superfamily protein
VTMKIFNQIFDQMDINGDGFISKLEMAKFVKQILNTKPEIDKIGEITNKLFDEFDSDNSGFLEKMECLKMLDTVL